MSCIKMFFLTCCSPFLGAPTQLNLETHSFERNRKQAFEILNSQWFPSLGFAGHSDEKNIYFWSLQDEEHQFAEKRIHSEKKQNFLYLPISEEFFVLKGCNDQGHCCNFKGLFSFFEVLSASVQL